MPEVRRLICAMVGPEEQRDFKLGWSLFRGAHQAIARRCHKESYQTKHAIRHDARGEPTLAPTDAAPMPATAAHYKEAGILTDAEWERVLEPFPKRLHPLRTEASGYRFQIRGAARRIEVRLVYSREAHPFRETP